MIAWYLPILSVYLQQNATVFLTCECNIEAKNKKKDPRIAFNNFWMISKEKKLLSLLPLNQWVPLRLLYLKNIWFEVIDMAKETLLQVMTQ